MQRKLLLTHNHRTRGRIQNRPSELSSQSRAEQALFSGGDLV
jgi:hypothetical protein